MSSRRRPPFGTDTANPLTPHGSRSTARQTPPATAPAAMPGFYSPQMQEANRRTQQPPSRTESRQQREPPQAQREVVARSALIGSPLHDAVRQRNAEAAMNLVRGGASVSTEDAEGETPLTLAIESGQAELFIAMIEEGRDKNLHRRNSNGETLLHRVIRARPYSYGAGSGRSHAPRANTSITGDQRFRLVKLLVEGHDVNPSTRDSSGDTALDAAHKNFLYLGPEREKIVEYLETQEAETEDVIGVLMRGGPSGDRQSEGGSFWLHPWVRVLVLLLLIGSHCCSYAADVHLRSEEKGSGQFPLVFDVVHFVGFAFPEQKSIRTTKIMLGIFGLLFGALLASMIFYWLLFRFILKCRIFGGGNCSPEPDESGRGILIVLLTGGLGGIYSAGLLYDYLLDSRTDAFGEDFNASFLRMQGDIGVSAFDVWKSVWCASVLCDLLLLATAIDSMMQMLAGRASFVPSSGYFGCCSCMQRGWRAMRYLVIWAIFLPAAASVILMVVLCPDWVNLHDMVIPTTRDAHRVALACAPMLFTTISMLQEWSWPLLAPLTSYVKLPGLCFGSNVPWFGWFISCLVLMMDGRHLYILLKFWSDNLDTSLQQFVLALCVAPAALAAVLLLIGIVGSAECCAGSRDIVVYFAQEGKDEDEANEGREQSPDRAKPVIAPWRSPSLQRSGSPRAAARSERLQRVDYPMPNKGPDVWSASYSDDIKSLCAVLDANPALADARGGIGIKVDHRTRTASLCAQKSSQCAAAPLHYAIVGNAKSSIAVLASRKANPRIRTSHGMWSALELAEILNRMDLADLIAESISPSRGGR